ncbi:MAG TPA: tripartite tricarboxylate transporter substrate binding protein [Usitatibacter sp.]|nr:tripartite tricarboxylate transporter substrate binding protein [Usitatibacter sp.]
MNPRSLKAAFFASSLFALLGLAFPALAQDAWPSRPVRIIVPFPAGGVADLAPRVVGQKLSEKWGQPVIVENKAGAAGNIGMGEGARAAPDGYTLVLAPTGNLTVNQFLFKLPFDTAKDLAPITLLATSPNVLVVNPSVPAKTFRELIDYAKANPGKLNFASPGAGSGAHLAGELLNIDAGIQATHVPYKGLAPAVTDLLGGQVQMMFAGISTVIQYVKNGKLVALAIASPQRSPQLPDVPTVAESGIPGFDVTSWYGLITRAGTPPAIIDKIQRDAAEVLRDPEVRNRFAGLGLEPGGNTPAEFEAMIASESRKWGDIVRKAHIPTQQ